LSHLKNGVLYKDTIEIIAVDGGSIDGLKKIRRYPHVTLIPVKERKSNTNECRSQSCDWKHSHIFTL
jgi:glycosyltransferase involved in cell wall biosynthesis